MRVGVLAKPEMPRWHIETLDNVRDIEGVTITHVVVDESVSGDDRMQRGITSVNAGRSVGLTDVLLFGTLLRETRLRVFLYVDEKAGWILFGETNRMRYLRTRPVESVDALSESTIEYCTPITENGWNRLPADTVDTIAKSCDVVLRFGFGLIRGDVLTAPQYGVLSTHGSDIREYRGMGPRIAFLRGESTATVTLQQLTDSIDGGRIVATDTKPLDPDMTLDELWGLMYEMQIALYPTGIRQLQDEDFSPLEPDELGRYYSHRLMEEDPRFVGKILLKNNLNRVKKAIGNAREGVGDLFVS